MRACCLQTWYINVIISALGLLMAVGCGSPQPANEPVPVVVAYHNDAQPDAINKDAANVQSVAEKSEAPALEKTEIPAEKVEVPAPNPQPVNNLLEAEQWTLVNDAGQAQAAAEIVRMPNGLRIIAPPTSTTYHAVLRRELTDNFEVALKLTVLSEEELRNLGVANPLPFPVRAGIRSIEGKSHSGLMIPRMTRQLVTLDFKLRGSQSQVGLYMNNHLFGSFERVDDHKCSFCLSMRENRGVLLEKVEVREGLEPDSELANAAKMAMTPSMMPPGMMGPGMMPPGMMGPGMMGPNMMGPNMMGPNMMGPNMMGPGMMPQGMMPPNMMNQGMPPGMMGGNMAPSDMPTDAMSQGSTHQGATAQGIMPSGSAGRSPFNDGSSPPAQAMTPNSSNASGAAAEFSKAPVPEPQRTEAFLNYQDWYVPLSGNTNQDQTISGNVRFNARGNGLGVEKLSTASNFWILRKITGQENYRYTLRVTIPSFSGLGGFDGQTQLAVGIFPFSSGAGISTILPGPFHHGPREVEFVATRIDGKVTATLDGQPVGDSATMPDANIMGVYLAGDIRLSFYDFVTNDVSSKPSTDSTNRSPAEILADCEKSILRIETESAVGKGAGTGFLVDGDGTFITSLYVLAGATSAKATLTDGTVCDVLGTLAQDPSRDIVIGKLALTSPKTLKLANQLPRKGDQVTTLGAPLGPTIVATGGVISAVRSGTEIPTGFQEPPFTGTWLQFDAASTRGNCGGPILDATGQVVAMSCLVSTQTAQNMNLGISSVDLLQLFTKSRMRAISPLATSMSLHVAGRRTALDAGIYDKALKEYVDQCRHEYSQLNRSLKDTIDAVASVIRDFEKGQTQIPTTADIDTDVVLLAGPQGKPLWLFRNADVKKRQIKRMQDHLRSLTRIRKQLTNVNDPESVLQLAMNFGSKLQLSVDKSVGFLTGAKVIEPLNKNELAITVDSTPCVIWLESTKGFDSGEQFLPQAVYIDGTKKVNVRNLSEPTVQLLRPVSESDLRRVLEITAPADQGANDKAPENKSAENKSADSKGADNKDAADKKNAPEPAAEYRTWSDTSGKFKIEATLDSFDGKVVKLKRRDGSIVSVPIEKLSQADQQVLVK